MGVAHSRFTSNAQSSTFYLPPMNRISGILAAHVKTSMISGPCDKTQKLCLSQRKPTFHTSASVTGIQRVVKTSLPVYIRRCLKPGSLLPAKPELGLPCPPDCTLHMHYKPLQKGLLGCKSVLIPSTVTSTVVTMHLLVAWHDPRAGPSRHRPQDTPVSLPPNTPPHLRPSRPAHRIPGAALWLRPAQPDYTNDSHAATEGTTQSTASQGGHHV